MEERRQERAVFGVAASLYARKPEPPRRRAPLPGGLDTALDRFRDEIPF